MGPGWLARLDAGPSCNSPWLASPVGRLEVPMSGCGTSPGRDDLATSGPHRRPAGDEPARVLLAYFSRPGENHWNGGRRDLRVGNTEVLAGLIAARLNCDVHRIEAAEPYSDDY